MGINISTYYAYYSRKQFIPRCSEQNNSIRFSPRAYASGMKEENRIMEQEVLNGEMEGQDK